MAREQGEKWTMYHCGYGEEWEQRFVEYLINYDNTIEDICKEREISKVELMKSVKKGIKDYRDVLPPGVADALQRGERPSGMIVLYFPALSETGEIVPDKPKRVRFAIPGRAYKERLYSHLSFKRDDGSVYVPIYDTRLRFVYKGLPSNMNLVADICEVAKAVEELQIRHIERYGTCNIFSKAGRRWSKVLKKVSEIRRAETTLKGLDRIKIEHPAAETAYQGIQAARAAVSDYLHLAIIESMFDDILDDLGESVRILSEFPDTYRWLLNRLLSWEYLSMENLEKMQAKTEEPSTKGLHIGWDECMSKMFTIIKPYAGSDGATYKVIKENLEANFPGMTFKIPNIRAAAKQRGLLNQGADID